MKSGGVALKKRENTKAVGSKIGSWLAAKIGSGGGENQLAKSVMAKIGAAASAIEESVGSYRKLISEVANLCGVKMTWRQAAINNAEN